MGGKVGAMRVAQMGQSRRASNTERGTGGGAQSGVGEHGTVVSEAEETRIERGIPERGEEQAVVHIEPLRVVAFGPRDDVGGPQQLRIGDAGDRAAGSPIVHQRGADDLLAHVLDDEPLGLGRLRQTGGLRTKPGERGVGKADGELVDSVEGRMERGHNELNLKVARPGPDSAEDGRTASSAATPG